MKDSRETVKKTARASVVLALKDWHICHPPHCNVRIKEGDDLSDVPEMYHENLKTEGVMPKKKGL